MSALENDKPFAVRKGKSPYEPLSATGGTGSKGYETLATGEFVAAVTTTPRQPELRRTGRLPTGNASQRQLPEPRAAYRTHWNAAKGAGEAMVAAALANDPIALTIAVDNLDMALARLWELRDSRDVNWQTILNHAQGMIKQLFTEHRVESLTAEQCQAVKGLVENYLGTSTKTTGDLNEAIRLIEDAGCDPYWAISGDPASDGNGQARD